MKQLFALITAVVLLAGCAGMGGETSGASGSDQLYDPTTDIYLGAA